MISRADCTTSVLNERYVESSALRGMTLETSASFFGGSASVRVNNRNPTLYLRRSVLLEKVQPRSEILGANGIFRGKGPSPGRACLESWNMALSVSRTRPPRTWRIGVVQQPRGLVSANIHGRAVQAGKSTRKPLPSAIDLLCTGSVGGREGGLDRKAARSRAVRSQKIPCPSLIGR